MFDDDINGNNNNNNNNKDNKNLDNFHFPVDASYTQSCEYDHASGKNAFWSNLIHQQQKMEGWGGGMEGGRAWWEREWGKREGCKRETETSNHKKRKKKAAYLFLILSRMA